MLKRTAEELRIGMSCLLLGLCVLWLWLTGGLEDMDDWPETDPSVSPQNDGERRATARVAPTDTPEGGRETAWEQRP